MVPAPDLSPMARQAMLSRMGRTRFDLLVIGGGISGAGIAHEAALRGLSVALLERQDFACGTSSKSSKMLHGGLRYLEQYRFHLVGEALRERNQLFGQVPHLAREQAFLYPVEHGRRLALWQAKVGVTLYDLLGSLWPISRPSWHASFGPDELRKREPCFAKSDIIGGLQYVDGITDDARLVIEVIKAATLLGARCVSYCPVEGFIRGEGGRVEGALARESLGGSPVEVRARAVVNAAGPWLDAVSRMDDPAAPRRLLPTKGVHVVVPRFTQHALILKSLPHADGRRRYLFVIPWAERSLVGTTDTANPGTAAGDAYLDDDSEATAEEVGYLLGSINAACPGVDLCADDVISAFGGWRPLIAPARPEFESDISREHEVFELASGLICLAGGKLTTYRVMAREVVDRVARRLKSGVRRHREAAIPHGGTSDLEDLIARESHGLPADEARAVACLARAYGTGCTTVLDIARQDGGLAGEIGRLSPEAPRWRAEVAHAVRHEGALTVSDVMARRLRIQLVDSSQGLACVGEVADLVAREMARSLGWSDDEARKWADSEATRFEADVHRSRAFRAQGV